MDLIWTDHGPYRRTAFEREADLEAAIIEVQQGLFGAARIYLDVKRKIGVRGGQQNIPDGYLIDLRGRTPKLYVVEVELVAHEPLRHIAVQILQFALAFEQEPRTVKSVLFGALKEQGAALRQCEEYAAAHQFRNLDHLLETLVFEKKFAGLVVIDELPENLQNVLASKFQFGVEVIEFGRYEHEDGRRIYRFEPFLADVDADLPTTKADLPGPQVVLDVGEIDTVVVPSREEGFVETFLGEDRWYAIRIHPTMRPQIKHIAVYRVAPVSAITHVALVRSIEPWKDSGKYVLNFAEPAREIGPIRYVKGGRVKHLQNLRYTTRARLDAAKTLDDVW
jgi:hypothetical protein